MQPGLAQTYAGLVPPLVYLADDMVRDVDPQVKLKLVDVPAPVVQELHRCL